MKKSVVAAAMLLMAVPAFAQVIRSHSTDVTKMTNTATSDHEESYNRIGISYTNTSYGLNDQAKAMIRMSAEDEIKKDISGISSNGFSIDYAHGWSLSKKYPMYLEAGLRFGFNAGSTTLFEESFKVDGASLSTTGKASLQNINFTIPVNFVWKFNVNALGNDFVIAPYTGINLKFNVSMRGRLKQDLSGSLPEGYEEYLEDYIFDSKWFSLTSSDKIYDKFAELSTGGGSYELDEEEADELRYVADNLTWKRFQMGWQIGVNFEYRNYCLGLEYGLDFLPAYSHSWDFSEEVYVPGYGYTDVPIAFDTRVNSGTFRLSLGYKF